MKKEKMEGKIYEKQVEGKWKKGKNGGKRRGNIRECGREERREVGNLVIRKDPR